MRSHPYTPPPPLPSVLDELTALAPLPNQRPRRASFDDAASATAAAPADIPLEALDPETSQLLPARKRRHRVRIQGKLALVRSISTANLSGKAAAQASGRAGGSLEGKRSGEDEELSQTSDTEEEAREVAVRDQQLRGYGIGGAGNIRRPTEVYGLSRPSEGSSTSGADRGLRNLRHLIGRMGDLKNRGSS
ncbi:hypothetical protein HYQ44_009649 [Verticillium longisporum]|nr:hypothetical protein HYQ44_009649 [Verticillium longisporum]